MRLRETRIAVRLRRTHQAGRPILLLIEWVAIAVVAATAAWSAVDPSTGMLAVTLGVALAVSTLLVVIASVVLPDDAPPAPSWFAQQRSARAAARKAHAPELTTASLTRDEA